MPKPTPLEQGNGPERPAGRATRNSMASRPTTPTLTALPIDPDQVRYGAANSMTKRACASLSGHLNRGSHISITNPEDVAQKYLDDKKCKNCISRSLFCYTEKDDPKNCVSCREARVKCVLLGQEKIKIKGEKSSRKDARTTTTTKPSDTANPEEASVNAPDGPFCDTDSDYELEDVEDPQMKEGFSANAQKNVEINAGIEPARDTIVKDTPQRADSHAKEIPREKMSLVGQLCELTTDIDKMLALNILLLSLSQNLADRLQGLEYAELTGKTEKLQDSSELDSWAKKSAEFEESVKVQMEEQVCILARKKEELRELNLRIASLAGTQKTELRERSQYLEKMKNDLENLERDHEKGIEKLEREMGKEAEQLSVVLRGKTEAAQNKRKASLGNDKASSTKRTKAD